jgi:hypothetical protein
MDGKCSEAASRSRGAESPRWMRSCHRKMHRAAVLTYKGNERLSFACFACFRPNGKRRSREWSIREFRERCFLVTDKHFSVASRSWAQRVVDAAVARERCAVCTWTAEAQCREAASCAASRRRTAWAFVFDSLFAGHARMAAEKSGARNQRPGSSCAGASVCASLTGRAVAQVLQCVRRAWSNVLRMLWPYLSRGRSSSHSQNENAMCSQA